MIPVGPLVAAIDDVPRQDEKVHPRMPAHRALQELPPALESGLGVAQIEEPQWATPLRRRLHGLPGAPSTRCPIAQGIPIDPVGLQSTDDHTVAPVGRLIQHVGYIDAGATRLLQPPPSP